MGLPKGKTNNLKGKPKGTISKKTKQWELLGEFITELGAEKFITEVNKLNGMDYVNAYSKILSYFKPQLQRTELKSENQHSFDSDPFKRIRENNDIENNS